MKIAVISDIHSNYQALVSVLDDIEKRNVDKIICLGDIIGKGVHSKECIKLIKEKCEVVLQGNCDEVFSKNYDTLDNVSDIDKARIKWNQSMLDSNDRSYLQQLPFCFEFYMGGNLVRLFHAHPTSKCKLVITHNSLQDKFNMFEPTSNTCSNHVADIVIYGHTHQQYMDRFYNKTIINTGSVGNPVDVIRNENKDSSFLATTSANYLIIEGDYGSHEYGSGISFQFLKVPYDIDKELEMEHLNLEKDDYRLELTMGKYRDMSKANENFRKIGIDVDKI